MDVTSKVVGSAERLQALDALDILDTPPEQEFDDVVHLTARLCETPVALVSLVDRDRQWFKARLGFPACETDLDSSVCKFVLSEPDLLIIPDLTKDSRTRGNPLVTGEPAIRFYAGAPLVTRTGQVLGSLCAIDTQPRPEGLSQNQRLDLRILARLTVLQLEARSDARARSEEERFARALVELGDRIRDLRTPGAMADVSAEIMGRALRAMRSGSAVASDPGGSGLLIETDWCAPGVASIVGHHDLDDYGAFAADLRRGATVAVSDVRTDPRTQERAAGFEALGVRSLINVPLLERGDLVMLQFVHFGEPQPRVEEWQGFVSSVGDRTRAGVARARAEEQQHLVNHEISHRLKNSLAMVQAMAMQTLKDVTDRSAVDAFEKRLRALSSAHDVLLRKDWSSADLADVVGAALSNLGVLAQCDIEGPPLLLGAGTTLSASLLVHELTTNALKYGSLSTLEGVVTIRWSVEGRGGPAELRLTWSEQGGPPAIAPTKKGFGSRLLATGLLGTGGASLSYGNDGFSAAFSAPLLQARTA